MLRNRRKLFSCVNKSYAVCRNRNVKGSITEKKMFTFAVNSNVNLAMVKLRNPVMLLIGAYF